jgi:hypothetical protein
VRTFLQVLIAWGIDWLTIAVSGLAIPLEVQGAFIALLACLLSVLMSAIGRKLQLSDNEEAKKVG